MSRVWQLQTAKNKLSEVVDRAIAEGPQIISRRSKEEAVVLSVADYRALRRRKTSLQDFFSQSPLRGVELDFERTKDTGRRVDL